ncbi:MAG: TetR family transcriptional regulator C-terminal domain-containing protein [Gemmataceae bacterium]
MAPKRSLNGHTAVRRNGHQRRIDVAAVRRDEIIDAAAAIIAEEGIQNLSLSGIEARTGMSRGQLTYYFSEKEQILLAVFDRMVERMRARVAEPNGRPHFPAEADAQTKAEHILEMLLHRPATDFTGLQYTFLAQVRHRRDFRQRLADLYADWRRELSAGLPKKSAQRDPRILASFVQAVFHGLVIQLEADPKAFDRAAMSRLCREVFADLLPKPKMKTRKGARNG